MELALILPVKMQTSSQKSILGLSDTGLLVGMRQTSMVTRDALMKLHQMAVIIRKIGIRMELTFPIRHGISIHINGTIYIAQRSTRCFPIQIG